MISLQAPKRYKNEKKKKNQKRHVFGRTESLTFVTFILTLTLTAKRRNLGSPLNSIIRGLNLQRIMGPQLPNRKKKITKRNILGERHNGPHNIPRNFFAVIVGTLSLLITNEGSINSKKQPNIIDSLP